jgi:hypothetical protein
MHSLITLVGWIDAAFLLVHIHHNLLIMTLAASACVADTCSKLAATTSSSPGTVTALRSWSNMYYTMFPMSALRIAIGPCPIPLRLSNNHVAYELDLVCNDEKLP